MKQASRRRSAGLFVLTCVIDEIEDTCGHRGIKVGYEAMMAKPVRSMISGMDGNDI